MPAGAREKDRAAVRRPERGGIRTGLGDDLLDSVPGKVDDVDVRGPAVDEVGIDGPAEGDLRPVWRPVETADGESLPARPETAGLRGAGRSRHVRRPALRTG